MKEEKKKSQRKRESKAKAVGSVARIFDFNSPLLCSHREREGERERESKARRKEKARPEMNKKALKDETTPGEIKFCFFIFIGQ